MARGGASAGDGGDDASGGHLGSPYKKMRVTAIAAILTFRILLLPWSTTIMSEPSLYCRTSHMPWNLAFVPVPARAAILNAVHKHIVGLSVSHTVRQPSRRAGKDRRTEIRSRNRQQQQQHAEQHKAAEIRRGSRGRHQVGCNVISCIYPGLMRYYIYVAVLRGPSLAV